MAKVYVSSTYFDLTEFRDRVGLALRMLGHDDISIEYYVAEEQRPIERCRADIEACDLFIGIYAWRYGWTPPEGNPRHLSLTELEYEHALMLDKPRMFFMLADDAPWPVNYFDSKRIPIERLRSRIRSENRIYVFTSVDDFTNAIKVMMHDWEMSFNSSKERFDRSSVRGRQTERLELPAPPEDLVKACLANECVLYAGSGLSAQANLPTWSLFVSGLLDWVKESGYVSQSFAASLKEAIEFGDVGPVADSIVNSVSSTSPELNRYLRRTFLSRQELAPRHNLVRSIPFCAALTTNFDNLLEKTFEEKAKGRTYTPQDNEQLLNSLSHQEFFVLKLYGTLERPATVIIAPAQYQAAVAENLLFSQCMESLFFSRTLLFIGASLDGIRDYLGGLKFRGTSSPRQHYALVDVSGSAWKVKAELLQRRYGIQVLPYLASPGYPEFDDFLKKLSDRVESARKQASHSAQAYTVRRSPTTWLRRLLLENVGPFESQSFDFERQWNVILGDNGVGKSSIIRAIAIALCGEEARAYADKLIKTDKTNATITLDIASEADGTIETRTYITKLFRTSTAVEVQTVPTRALEAENLLSLGFPPLRSMSSSKATEVQSRDRKRPDPGDLMPLIIGEPDLRLDSLKNWIMELDHQINSDKVEESRQRSVRLFEQFFKVISELTPGVNLAFESIDVPKKRVMVKTNNEVVPLEYVSQGTSSLIGWIGILLRRLFDMYGELDDPQNQYALVLIDEIDAHMHPAWQQSLATSIRKLFPNLQVIATTHSPLIVPSLTRDEILSLRRDPATSGVIVERPEKDYQGYRADQVLTSSLFRLMSSRDPETYKALIAYTDLAVRDEEQLDYSDKLKLKELSEKLQLRLPLPEERAEARMAFDLIRDSLEEKIKKMDLEARGKILDEVKAQLLEISPDAWRL